MSRIFKVCLFGPESTGKSTLAENLARHYKTCFVPEYAKILIENRGGKITLDDIPSIAKGQMENEDKLLNKANKVLFCDTDLMTTVIWSEWLFGQCPAWVQAEADKRTYDIYLLTYDDVPWVPDIHRYIPEDRRRFLTRCKRELDKRHIHYVKIKGNWEQRFKSACNAVNALLKVTI